MQIKIKKFQKKVESLKEKHHLNNTEIAEIMGLEYSYVFRVFKGETDPGMKFINGVEKFCKKFNIDSKDYIFLE